MNYVITVTERIWSWHIVIDSIIIGWIFTLIFSAIAVLCTYEFNRYNRKFIQSKLINIKSIVYIYTMFSIVIPILSLISSCMCFISGSEGFVEQYDLYEIHDTIGVTDIYELRGYEIKGTYGEYYILEKIGE